MATAQEDVLKKLAGIKDSRSIVGEMARGKNMYPGGNAAQSGPGGPDMGRPPTAVPQAAMDAVRQQVGMPVAQPNAPPAAVATNPAITKSQAKMNRAMQAAAQRSIQRGR
jgi:hypothetical protein